MSVLEIVLLIIGFISVAVSFIFFMIADGMDTGTSSDINVGLSDKQKQEIKKQIVDAYSEQMDEMTDTVYEKTELALEKLSNQKIKELNDYSETVLGDINKNHTEVMFLYDMLNEKNKEVHNNIRDISIAADQLNAAKDEAIDSAARLKDAFSEEKEMLENAVNVANAAVANAENAANVANAAVANAESAANTANAAVANAESAANAANAAVANAESVTNAANAAVANAESVTNAANAAVANAESATNAANAAVANAESATNAANAAVANAESAANAVSIASAVNEAGQAGVIAERKPARTRTSKKAIAEETEYNAVNAEDEASGPVKKKTVPRKKTQVIKEAALQLGTQGNEAENAVSSVPQMADTRQEDIVTNNNIAANDNIAANNTATNNIATGNNAVTGNNAAADNNAAAGYNGVTGNNVATGYNVAASQNAAAGHIMGETGNNVTGQNVARSTEADMEYKRVRNAPELRAGNVNVTKGRSKKAAILDLYREGKSNVDIAKTLGLGIGEVRLVIDLYKGQR